MVSHVIGGKKKLNISHKVWDPSNDIKVAMGHYSVYLYVPSTVFYRKYLCFLSLPWEMSSKECGGYINLLFRNLQIVLEYPLITERHDCHYMFFHHWIRYSEILLFQLPGRATSFDSQGSCSSPRPPSTP